MTKRFTTGVAQIEPRFLLWQKVRLPLAAAVIIVLLIVSALLIRSFLTARGIATDLERAEELAAADTFSSHREAQQLLQELNEEHPDHGEIGAQRAWQEVLVYLRFGATDEQVTRTAALLRELNIEPNTALGEATLAGLALLQGEDSAALEQIGEEPETREGQFVRAMILASRGEVDTAIRLHDQARQGQPTFIPALGEMIRLLRQRGRFTEARAALSVITRISPDHEGAAVQSALLSMDSNALDREALTKMTGPLSEKISALSIDESHPRMLAYKNFAEGRLDLLRGEVEPARRALEAAARELGKSQAVATWLAVAHHRAGDHQKALDALASFPDEPATDPSLLKTRFDILLDLQRTEAARAPLDILNKIEGFDASMVRARMEYAEGDYQRALEPLREAMSKNHGDAALLLADSFIQVGKIGSAQRTLREAKLAGGLKLCAAGFLANLDGETKRARGLFFKASQQGERCGSVFAGKLLLGAGIAAEQQPFLSKALEEREDVRDRVLLGRMRFRTEGAAKARSELDRVRELRPEAAVVLRELALAYEELNALDVAQEVADTAVSQTKGNPLVVAAAAQVARERGEARDALARVEKGLESHSKSTYLRLEKAAALDATGRLAEAEEAADEAITDGPLFAEATCLRAWILMRRGSREDAQVDLMRALTPARRAEGVGGEAAVRSCLVELHVKRGPSAKSRAKTQLYFLKRLPHYSARLEYLSGMVARSENKISDATSHFNKALELDPAHRESWRELAKLRPLTPEQRARFEKLFPGQTASDR